MHIKVSRSVHSCLSDVLVTMRGCMMCQSRPRGAIATTRHVDTCAAKHHQFEPLMHACNGREPQSGGPSKRHANPPGLEQLCIDYTNEVPILALSRLATLQA